MSLELRAPGAALEIRRIPADFVIVGESYDFEVEVVATVAHAVAEFAFVAAGYLEISPNAGGDFYPVPVDVNGGYDLGAFAAAQRKTYILRFTVPAATPLRTALYGIHLGI